MVKSEDLYFHSLKAISPIDGRHRIMTEPLAEYFSEFALFKYRIHLEVEYLVALSELGSFKAVREFTNEEKEFLRNLVNNFSLEDAQIIQNIDRFGYQGMKPTNHDFKAAEYFIKMRMQETSLKDIVEMVHFGLTTEDANNIAHNCMIREALKFHYFPKLIELLDSLSEIAEKEKETVMLGRTHGQPGTPTTFGKEMANFLERLRKELVFLTELKLPAKLNGAVGNHAAQQFSSPEIDWIKFVKEFVTKLGFEPNLHTTQIEPHDGLTKLCGCFISINNILRDLAVDLWLYTAQGCLRQGKIAHEVGSSTMPHKINPWRVEVAEGSTVEANAKFMGFVQKWQASRLQRDLSDHEAQRAIGVGIAHSYVAVLHVMEELERLEVNREKIRKEMENFGSVLTEAVQTLLRKEGYEKPYELMKDFSRGRHCTSEELYDFIEGLDVEEEIKQRLKKLKPEDYVGLSVQLVEIALKNWQEFKEDYYQGKIKTKEAKPQVVAVLGGQWGDEGKGKIVDLVAENFDLAARATGGNNAGHTVVIKGEKHIFHLIPSAITWEKVDCLLGNGMVIDPLVLLKEIDTLKQRGYLVNNLFISGRAHVILLYHKMLDWYQEEQKGKKKVGTTSRGIGPGYADKIFRTGIRVNDLLNKEILGEKIKHHLQEKFGTFKHLHKKEEQEILRKLHEAIPEEEFFREYKEKLLEIGNYLDRGKIAEVLTELYISLGQKLRSYITETGLKLEQAYLEGKNILLEGAQGILLDIDHGTYPFVTSSNPTVGGLKTGLGFPHIDEVYSVIKAYTTRVGGGPFPTELGTEEETKNEGRWEDIKSGYEEHLMEAKKKAEKGEEYFQGKYMRLIGKEYGSTTGRPRRCGWHDAVLTRHTSRVNGKRIVITKLDVLSGLKKLKICNSYEYTGPEQIYNGEEYYSGKIIKKFPADGYFLEHCKPHEWIEMDGWEEDISKVKSFEELPEAAKKYLRKIEELGKVEISLVSIGPEREQIIFVPGRWSFPTREKRQTKKVGGKYKAVIYDMDNTLVATDRFVFDLIKKTALKVNQEMPFPVPDDGEIVAVQKKNLPFEEIFSVLFPNPEGYLREEALWKIILERYRERAKEMPYSSTLWGVEIVKGLKQQGIIQGILTNRVKMAEKRLEQAGYTGFDFLIVPENKKPSPESFKEVLLFLEGKGIKKEEILSVGDHGDDYLASKGAGVDFVAVLTGSTPKEEFLKLGLGEKSIIEDLRELKEVL